MRHATPYIGALVVTAWWMAGCSTPARSGATTSTIEVCHFCSCVEENPSTYNDLLDSADTCNAAIDSNTVSFIRAKGLWTGDFDAAFMAQKNGNWKVTIWCSRRTKAVMAASQEYETLVEKWIEPYEAALTEAHKKVLNMKPNEASQAIGAPCAPQPER